MHPGWSGLSSAVEEEIIRVKYAIAQIFVSFAVERIGSPLRAQAGDSTGKFAPFGFQITGLDFELLNRVLRWNQDGQVDVTDVEGLSVEILGALVSERPVNLVIIPAEGIYADGCARGTPLRNHGRSQNDQIEDIATVERQFVRFPLFHHRANGRRFSIEGRRASFDRYAFRRRPQDHFKIHFYGILHVQNDA